MNISVTIYESKCNNTPLAFYHSVMPIKLNFPSPFVLQSLNIYYVIQQALYFFLA